MAIAERWLAGICNKPGYELFNYDVYALCGDGDMMEGISGEAASLAGHLKLSNLCWIYDNNRITIEGHTALAFTEDVATRFIRLWLNVTRVGDANDLDMLTRAFECFKRCEDRPTLIIVDSHIAMARPISRTPRLPNGEPLGEDEIRLTKRNLRLAGRCQVPGSDEVRENFRNGIGQRGKGLRTAWEALLNGIRRSIRYWPTIYCDATPRTAHRLGQRYSHLPCDLRLGRSVNHRPRC